MAGYVMDLTALLETWPVPRSLKLDDELQREVSGLCGLSGGNLCGTNHCVANDGAGSRRGCRLDWMTNHALERPRSCPAVNQSFGCLPLLPGRIGDKADTCQTGLCGSTHY